MKTKIWKYIKEQLEMDKRVVLLIVLESIGSSPGRAGFKMAVVNENDFTGTIGGGNVEFKLIRQAAKMLNFDIEEPLIIKQIHNNDEDENSSGMICSGEQTVLLYPLDKDNIPLVEDVIDAIKNKEEKYLLINNKGISRKDSESNHKEIIYNYESVNKWEYKESLAPLNKVYIFGAGHICLALSELLIKIGFYVTIFDDRKDLDLLNQNSFAHEKRIIDYSRIDELIPDDSTSYFIIMTYSHKADSLVLSKLINKNYKYLGMMGSPSKVEEVFSELTSKGIAMEKLKKVNAPIGVQIKSKTVEEIAVSIAAQLIKIKNE